MKKYLVLSFLVGLLFFGAKSANAVVSFDHCCKIDCAKLGKLPNIVACYESGTHGIVGENETHTGADFVKKLGHGVFFQFFCGTSPSEGLHRVISIWTEKKQDKCPPGWILVPNAFPSWGDYLAPGADYCVKNIVLPCKEGCEKPCPNCNLNQ